MATYVVTDTENENWDGNRFKYRYRSRDGHPVAQQEIDRRKAARKPFVLWRWVGGIPELVEKSTV